MPVLPNIGDLVSRRRLHLCLLVLSGSRAYGIEVEGSDDDYVGIFVPALEDFLGVYGFGPETHTGSGPDFTLHELGKFCRLALKGNPTILETLWNPNVVAQTPVGERLVGLRKSFLHRGSLEVYVDYAEAQLKRMVKGKGLHAKGGTYNPKYGAHLVRLLHAGIALAEAGEVTVRVPPEQAKTLLEIRSGARTMKDVLALARPLLERLKGLAKENPLPPQPDVAAVNALVVEARRNA